MNDNYLKIEGLTKFYPLPKGQLKVFENLNFELKKNELVAVMGVSGVGKTTLLNLIGTLDKPTDGKIFVNGKDIFSMDEESLIRFRRDTIGFIFQFHHLLPEFSAEENISIPLMIKGVKRKEALERAREVLKEVGMEDRAKEKPSQLSGGENQRVAVARALCSEPELLLADEPTGNLDPKTAIEVFSLIKELHLKKGVSTIVVTHNEKIANKCDRIFFMEKYK
ncbi:MAG: ABC transporter ATP-binding protein [Acidobacteriota bacterium]